MPTFDQIVGYLDSESFWENIAAGFVVMALDLVLVVAGVGLLVSYLQKRQWDKTRQSLTYVLLAAMTRVMRHVDACLIIKEGRVFLNAAIELHLARLDLALNNFNEQTIVHLPALLPPLSEDLSNLTRAVLGLQNEVLAAQLHLRDLTGSIGAVGTTDVARYLVDPKEFRPDSRGHSHLRPDVPPRVESYFVLSLLQIFERARFISKKIKEFSKHARAWRTLDVETKEKAVGLLATIGDLSDKPTVIESTIKGAGLYLVYAIVPASDVKSELPGATQVD